MNARTDPRLRALAFARIVLGTLVLVRTTPLIALARHPLIEPPEALLGWPSGRWSVPLGLALPTGVVGVLCVVRTAAALGFALGSWTRASGLSCAAAGVLVLSQDAFGATHTFRLLFGSIALLALTDCASTWAVRRAAPLDVRSSGALVRWWLASIYAWAAVAKLNAAWWSGAVLRLDAADGVLNARVARFVGASDVHAAAAAVVALVAEAGLALLLASGRAPRLVVGVAVGTHIALEWIARPDVFGVAMVAMLPILWRRDAGPRADARTSADGSRDA